LNNVRKITMPALVIHGQYDSIVPVAEGEKIYASVSSQDKKIVIIPNADHNTIFFEGMELYLRELGDFIRRLK
jgi:pimeloyl-ACP methyl ester carboxylesterase